MPSIGSIFSIASSALRSQQQGLDVTGHNIANANTEGYSRQRARLSALNPVRTTQGVFGTGVGVQDVEQVRDVLLDRGVRARRSALGGGETRGGYLSRVEELLAEPGDSGIGGALDRFFSAFSELATNPSSTEARTVVRSRAQDLARSFNSMADSLDALRQEAEARLQDDVSRANRLLGQVAALNDEIVATEADGVTAADLRDERGRALDALAGILDITVTQRDDGSVGVHSDGRSLVERESSRSLVLGGSSGALELSVEGGSTPLQADGGSLGGGLAFLNGDLPDVRSELDTLAAAITADVNALHRTGVNPDGVSEAGFDGVAFFDPAGITANTMGVSTWVEASVGAIAAGTPDAGGTYRAGANDVALAVADLRQEPSPTLGSDSLAEDYRSLVTDVGGRSRDVQDRTRFHETLLSQAEQRRLSLSSVSTDEELVQLIQFQTAYQAAARVVTTADEMIQSLLVM